MKNVKRVLANNLRRIRKDKDISQADLAHQVGIATNSIAAIEQARTWPTVKNIEAIAQALNVNQMDLFFDGDSIPEPSSFQIVDIVTNALKARDVLGSANLNDKPGVPQELALLWAKAPATRRNLLLEVLRGAASGNRTGVRTVSRFSRGRSSKKG